MPPFLTVTLRSELDVIASRQRTRHIAALCGFGRQDQTRLSTAVSEMARHACGPGGMVQFSVTTGVGRQCLVVLVETLSLVMPDSGIQQDLQSSAESLPWITTARRFFEQCEVAVDSKLTRVTLRKPVPLDAGYLTLDSLRQAISSLGELPANVALSDSTQENRVLNDVLANLQAKQVELLRMTKELEETNQKIETLNRLLNEKAESLVLADRRKDEFLSTLSHELRSPLSATLMGAQMLKRGSLDEVRVAHVGQLITRQAAHMSRLVEDLLDISRISRGLFSIDKEAFDMREVVEAAVEQLTPALQKKNHRIEVTLPLVACIVDGDRTRLTQVLANLLGNAIRYTPDAGNIQVRLQLHETSLSVEVADNGIGIPAHLMPHLFDLYVQAARSPDARNGGLGIGLSLVRSLVELHRGTVSATSAGEGHGSSFKICLQLANATVAESSASLPLPQENVCLGASNPNLFKPVAKQPGASTSP